MTGKLAAHLRLPLFRTAYALMLSNMLTSGLGLVYWVLGARLYAPDVVGVNSALISTMMFLSGISQLNLRSALNRFIPEAGRRAGRLIGLSYLATLPVAVLVVLVFFWGLDLWAAGGPLAVVSADPVLLGWFVVATASWGIFNMQDGVLTGLQRALVVPFENLLFATAKMVLLVLFAAPFATLGIFASWTIPTLIGVVALTVWVYRRVLPGFVGKPGAAALPLRASQVARFVAADYLGALFVLAYVSLLPVIIISVVGAQAGAYFYIVWIIATSLNLLPLSLSISHTVETVASGADPIVEARTVLLHMAKILIPIVAIVVVSAPWILSVFGPGYATAGTDLLRLMALGVLPYAVNVLYFSLARIQKQLRGAVIAQAVLAISTPLASILLLETFGLTGVGVAWLVSQSAVALVILATVLRPVLSRPKPSDADGG